MSNMILNCPLCGGDVHVKSVLSKKNGVDYREYYDKHEIPPLSEFATKCYCTCKKSCFATVRPDLIVGEVYNTEQEATAVWNRDAAYWNEKLKEIGNETEE